MRDEGLGHDLSQTLLREEEKSESGLPGKGGGGKQEQLFLSEFSEIPDSSRTPSSLASCPNLAQEQLRNPGVENYQIKRRREMFSWN